MISTCLIITDTHHFIDLWFRKNYRWLILSFGFLIKEYSFNWIICSFRWDFNHFKLLRKIIYNEAPRGIQLYVMYDQQTSTHKSLTVILFLVISSGKRVWIDSPPGCNFIASIALHRRPFGWGLSVSWWVGSIFGTRTFHEQLYKSRISILRNSSFA